VAKTQLINNRENDFNFHIAGEQITIPGGKFVEGKFEPGTGEIDSDLLTKAMDNPAISAWFEGGHLTKGEPKKAAKPAAEAPKQ
jgi:hypothetical protein